MKPVSADDTFAMLAKGRKCSGCGDTRIAMVSIPHADGQLFTLEEVGEKCWCYRCAIEKFAIDGVGTA